jgi:hypothetical protein
MQLMKKLLPRLLLAACLLPAGMAAAEASDLDGTLDLRIPDIQTLNTSSPITILPADSQEETVDIAVVGASLPEGSSNLEVSRAGLGSIYWAARRPAARAWRVVFPITPDEAPIVYEDLRVACALARPIADQAACP